jgi:hypothetical protein
MDYPDLFATMAAAGVTIRVADDGLQAGPSERLTDELRSAIREHRERLHAARCGSAVRPPEGTPRATATIPSRMSRNAAPLATPVFREADACHEG